MAQPTQPMRSTVLIVDDESGPRESLRMILAPHYRVLQAQSGAEALEILRRETVELITVDLNMPGMLGQELMRSVRAEFPEVEIIVITGCGSLESAAEGIRCGISDYLQKPFDVVQVSAAVVRAVSRQQARTRLGAFLRALGEVVGAERSTDSILEDVRQSPALRGRVGELLAEPAVTAGPEESPSMSWAGIDPIARPLGARK